eukprot:1642494-Karenia_brevis.AAC.1
MQVLTCPGEVIDAEKRALAIVGKYPYNMHTKVSSFGVSILGCSAPRSIEVTAYASKIRLMHALGPAFGRILDLLDGALWDWPLAGLRGRCPRFWDHDAFAIQMFDSLSDDWAPGWVSGLVRQVKGVVRESRVLPKPRIQKHVYNFALSAYIGDGIQRLLDRRFCQYFGCGALPPGLVWSEVFAMLGSHHLKFQLLRTVLGGWITSRRISGGFGAHRQCIFQCSDCDDSLQHYVCCPVLKKLCSECLHGFVAYEAPPQCWGLVGSAEGRIIQVHGLALSCLLYHSLRHLDFISFSRALKNFKHLVASDPIVCKVIANSSRWVYGVGDDGRSSGPGGDGTRIARDTGLARISEEQVADLIPEVVMQADSSVFPTLQASMSVSADVVEPAAVARLGPDSLNAQSGSEVSDSLNVQSGTEASDNVAG